MHVRGQADRGLDERGRCSSRRSIIAMAACLALEVPHKLDQRDIKRVGDASGGRDAGCMPSEFDLAEVAGVHAGHHSASDVLEALGPALAGGSDRRAKGLGGRIGFGPARHGGARCGRTPPPATEHV
jgi:hypothetical protein